MRVQVGSRQLIAAVAVLVGGGVAHGQGPRTVLTAGGGGLFPTRAIGTYGVAGGRLTPTPGLQLGFGLAASSDRYGADLDFVFGPGTRLDIRPTQPCGPSLCYPISNPSIKLSIFSATGWVRPAGSRFRLEAGIGVAVRRVGDYSCACGGFNDPFYLDAGRFRARHTALGAAIGVGWSPDRKRPYELGVEDVIATMETGRVQHYLTAVARVRWRSSGPPGER